MTNFTNNMPIQYIQSTIQYINLYKSKNKPILPNQKTQCTNSTKETLVFLRKLKKTDTHTNTPKPIHKEIISKTNKQTFRYLKLNILSFWGFNGCYGTKIHTYTPKISRKKKAIDFHLIK